MKHKFRDIPAPAKLIAGLIEKHPTFKQMPSPLLMHFAKDSITTYRQLADSDGDLPDAKEYLLKHIHLSAQKILSKRLGGIINATGVILHTNFGRAPLAAEALQAVQATSSGYSNLEFDVLENKRGKRGDSAAEMLLSLTGAEDATFVNNCAAAIYLCLRALAKGSEVIVSRGELVQIGGGFRVPDILAESDAKLVEVGTTNITTIADYERALTESSKALLVVHRSNFVISGHTKKPEVSELVALAKKHQVPLIYDLGSGALKHWPERDRYTEPLVSELIREGVDLVTFSGDKLLGGPQAGLICGQASIIEKLKTHPMARALRLGKMSIAALEATLNLYLLDDDDKIPVRWMIKRPQDEISKRANSLTERLVERGIKAKCEPGFSKIGGGSNPEATLNTTLIRIKVQKAEHQVRQLLICQPAIACRIQEDQLCFDLRTVFPEQEATLLEGLSQVLLEAK